MSNSNDKNLTIRDIAELANVSVATVSRVMNDPETVRVATRQRVTEIMTTHNYKPNLVARSLSTKRSMLLGCVLPDITNPFFAAVFLAAEIRALELGYNLLLINTMNKEAIETEGLLSLHGQQVDGIFLLAGRANESQPTQSQLDQVIAINKHIPIVLINGDLPGANCYRVVADEANGTTKLINYLTNVGHRHIILVGGLAGNTSTDLKVDAFRTAMAAKGLDTPPGWFIPGRWAIEDGIRIMQQLLQETVIPTAIVAVNDLVAIGIIQAAQTHGLRVPEDISVAGFDDTFLAAAFSPRLTSVSQNYAELGKAAVDVMEAAIKGEESVPRETTVKTELMIRESCKPASP